ncbi:hypothetical protein SAMN05428975_1705 [Mucilaginibacter sp. OK268]|nr:hypothetical protein SAMN05428975_1705 [Mucilaginibacter sp. OK268]
MNDLKYHTLYIIKYIDTNNKIFVFILTIYIIYKD